MSAADSAAATTALLVEAGAAGSESSVVLCEVRWRKRENVVAPRSLDATTNDPFSIVQRTTQVAHTKDAIAGVYDPVRHHLYVANPEGGCSRLWSLPECHALLCPTDTGDWKVLLVPEGGATLLPPR